MNPSNLRCSAILSSVLAASAPSGGALAGEYELVIEEKPMDVTGWDPTDVADVTGDTYTFLVNGRPPVANWTALYRRGERIRLRFINGSAMTYFDVRIPGLTMTVVQADGQDVQPVTVDELRIAVAETYDVLVEPVGDGAYTIFAEAMDRSGYARGTLASQAGRSAPIPALRPPPLLTMADMGMAHDPTERLTTRHGRHGARLTPERHARHGA